MAKKKDFSNVNVNPVYNTIAEATAEPLPGQIEITTGETVTEARKTRKGYTQAEKEEFLENLQTAGRKGCKLPRINLAFSPQVYDYVRTRARAQGITITQFCNTVMLQHMEDHKAVYDKAVEFRNSL